MSVLSRSDPLNTLNTGVSGLGSIYSRDVVVIIYHSHVEVWRRQVSPITANKGIESSCTCVVCIAVAFVLTCNKRWEETANRVSDKFTCRNLYTKAVSYPLEFSFFYLSRGFWTVFLGLLSRYRIHSHGKYRIETLRSDEARMSR
jgi:hypothetical protein